MMKQSISALLLLLFPLLSHCQDIEPTEADLAVRDLQRAILMTDATMERSFTGNTAMLMYDTYNLETQKGSGAADVWPYTAAIEAHCSVIEAIDALSDQRSEYSDTRDRYVQRLKQLFNSLDYYRGTYTLNSYARIASWSIYGVHRSGTKGTAAVTGIENVYDDQMWICRELVRAYRLTGDNDYLTKAEYLANYCIDGWDCCLDANGNEYGGISWGPGYNSKHSCSNGPIIQPLVWLSEIYKTADEEANLRYFYILPDGTRTNEMRRHSEVYLEMARKVYAWQKEKLLNRSTGVYWDMLGAVTGEIQYVGEGRNKYRTHVDSQGPSGTAYTYNTGTMLAGTAELYRVTGEESYLEDLNALAQSSWRNFAKGRRINGNVFYEWPTDSKAEEGFNAWFDNVLMRAYVDAADQNTTVYNGKSHAENALSSFQQNLDYAFDNYNRYDMLPINLLNGWEVSTGNANVTKGFHQLAFASEYAMLAVWHSRQSQMTDGIDSPNANPNPNLNPNANKSKIENTVNRKCFDLLGRSVSFSGNSSQPSIVIVNGKKQIANSSTR